MNFLVSSVTHLPPIKVAQRKQYKELPSPQVSSRPIRKPLAQIERSDWFIALVHRTLYHLPLLAMSDDFELFTKLTLALQATIVSQQRKLDKAK